MRAVALMLPTILCVIFSSQAARYALLVGNAEGGRDETPLKYVSNDLKQFRSVLTTVCGFESGNVTMLYNATASDLKETLAQLRNRLSCDTARGLLLFYYTGHADEKSLKMGTGRYALSELKDVLSSVPAHIRIGVFDACQSGSFTRLKGGRLAEPFLFKNDTKIKGQVILSSSAAEENSQESDKYRASVFTFHLLNALRGSGDSSGDGRVTLGEAYQYSYSRTVSSTARSPGGTQHPGYQFRIQGEGDIVLADLNVYSAGILLTPGTGGEFTVVDGAGNLVADLTKESASRVMIALADGAYRVIRREQEATWIAQVSVDGNVLVPVKNADFQKAEPQGTRPKGRPEPGTHVDPVFYAGGEHFRLDRLERKLDDQFSRYRMFGMKPNVHLPHGTPHVAQGIDLWIRDQFQLCWSVGYSFFDWDGEHRGGKLNRFDGNEYGYRFSHRETLELFTFYTGTGVKIPRGLLRGLVFHGGAKIYLVRFNVSSHFHDSLYNVHARNKNADEGTLVLPSVGVSYRYPVTRILSLGVLVRYRYQKKRRALSGSPDYAMAVQPSYMTEVESPTYKYSFGGLGAHFFVSANFRRR